MPRQNVNDLLAFIAVAREQSFTRAAAKLGDQRGVIALADAAGDPRKGSRALALLEELGRLDAAPAATKTPEHAALTELADWLAYPTEFGAYPDALRVYDNGEAQLYHVRPETPFQK